MLLISFLINFHLINKKLISLLISFHIINMESYRCILWCLVSFIQYISQIYLFCYGYQQFFPFYLWVVFHFMTTSQIVHPLTYEWTFIYALSSFWRFWMMYLWIFEYNSLCGHMVLYLLGWIPRSKLPCHM